MSMFLFERILIIQIDENKDGIFDFNEMTKFILDHKMAKNEEQAKFMVVKFFNSHENVKDPKNCMCPKGSLDCPSWILYGQKLGFTPALK